MSTRRLHRNSVQTLRLSLPFLKDKYFQYARQLNLFCSLINLNYFSIVLKEVIENPLSAERFSNCGKFPLPSRRQTLNGLRHATRVERAYFSLVQPLSGKDLRNTGLISQTFKEILLALKCQDWGNMIWRSVSAELFFFIIIITNHFFLAIKHSRV